jgi:transcriptional regulator with XRE-family HTH domain
MTVAVLSIKTDDFDTLGGRLSRAREAKNASLAQISELVGVEAKTLKAWESDRTVPRSNRLTMLAGALGISVSWLLYGRGASPMEEADSNPNSNNVESTRLQLDQLKNQRQKISTEILDIEESLRQTTAENSD